MCRTFALLSVLVLSTATALAQGRNTASAVAGEATKLLQIYVVDTEGGKAALWISPTRRDAAHRLGKSRAVVTPTASWRRSGRRRHEDRLPAVDALPRGSRRRHEGPGQADSCRDVRRSRADRRGPVNRPPRTGAGIPGVVRRAYGKAKHLVVKPGDRVPITGIDWRIVTSAGEDSRRRCPAPDSRIRAAPKRSRKKSRRDPRERPIGRQPRDVRGSSARSIWAICSGTKRCDLMCPNNKVGTVDLYMVSHHGTSPSGSPALVRGFQPRAARDAERHAEGRRARRDGDDAHDGKPRGHLAAALVLHGRHRTEQRRRLHRQRRRQRRNCGRPHRPRTRRGRGGRAPRRARRSRRRCSAPATRHRQLRVRKQPHRPLRQQPAGAPPAAAGAAGGGAGRWRRRGGAHAGLLDQDFRERGWLLHDCQQPQRIQQDLSTSRPLNRAHTRNFPREDSWQTYQNNGSSGLPPRSSWQLSWILAHHRWSGREAAPQTPSAGPAARQRPAPPSDKPRQAAGARAAKVAAAMPRRRCSPNLRALSRHRSRRRPRAESLRRTLAVRPTTTTRSSAKIRDGVPNTAMQPFKDTLDRAADLAAHRLHPHAGGEPEGQAGLRAGSEQPDHQVREADVQDRGRRARARDAVGTRLPARRPPARDRTPRPAAHHREGQAACRCR